MLLGIPLIYFFSSSDEEKTFTDSQNEFVKQTEQLIADLSEDAKYSSKSHKLSTEDNRTDTSSTVPQTETLMSAEPQEEITTQVDFTPEENKASLPKWKKELDIFLQGEKSPKEFLDSLTIDNWKEVRNALALAYEEKKLPEAKNFQDRFWTRVGEVGGQAVAEELLRGGDPAFAKILKGWAKKTPQEMFDYYADLNLKSP